MGLRGRGSSVMVALIVEVALLFLVSAASMQTQAQTSVIVGDYWKYSISGDYTLLDPSSSTELSLQTKGTRTIWISGVDSRGPTTVGLDVLDMKGTYYSGGTAVPISFHIVENVTTMGTVSQSRFSIDITAGTGYLSFSARLSGTSVETATSEKSELELNPGSRYTETYQVSAHATWVIPLPGETPSPIFFQGETVTEAIVGRQQQVTVPVGSFTATLISSWTNTTGTGEVPYVLSEGNGDRTVSYYVPEVGGYVKTVSYDQGGIPQFESNLVAFSHEAPQGGPALAEISPIALAGAVAGAAAVIIAAMAVALTRRKRRATNAPVQYFAASTQSFTPSDHSGAFDPPPPDTTVPPNPPIEEGKEP